MTDVDRIAKLAGLHLDPDEEHRMKEHFKRMLEYVRRLEELDLGDVPPLAHPHGSEGPLRKDEPGNSLDRDNVLKEAPDTFHSYFRVPSPLKDVEKTRE
jgi:aspartyl-tRNA(Asn)/glutamyl-tRNA(Gln) amidotransferase subunit C